MRLFSIAPYRILPATTGGQWGIVSMHEALGGLCEDHIIGTADNGPETGYPFKVHRVFPVKPVRYLPLYKSKALASLARELGSTHIFCDHPYMAPTAIALSSQLKIPWFLRSHNIESLRFKTLQKPWWPLLHAFEKTVMRRADGIFFISPEDRDWAIKHYGVQPAISYNIPYGTLLSQAPEQSAAAKLAFARQEGLNPDVPWFYFLGVHSYQPNADAVKVILEQVLPRLEKKGLQCQILIGGKGLPEELQALIAQTKGVARYMGFIENLDLFINACDMMLNPVNSGGGIKTKAVEALGYNKIVISTLTGAAGILPTVCGDNLKLAGDEDWDAFTEHCINACTQIPAIPSTFYAHYNWGAIAHKVVDIMNSK
jgi:glycosyltransferase involved in cell wall biosynthesis